MVAQASNLVTYLTLIMYLSHELSCRQSPITPSMLLWHNIIFQNQVCFERLMRLNKTPLIFVKLFIARNWQPHTIPAMFHGNRTSSYETMAKKFRPSVAFNWQYWLQTATIRTTEAQRRCVVGTSVAGMKAAAIGRIFDITTRTVQCILAR